MTIDMDKFEELARAATPGGEWFQVQDKVYRNDMVKGETFSDGFVCEIHDGPVERARYIAAANPAAVLELVQRLRAAEAQAVIADEATKFYDALDVDQLDPEYFGSGSDGHRYRGLRDAVRAYRRAVETTKP